MRISELFIVSITCVHASVWLHGTNVVLSSYAVASDAGLMEYGLSRWQNSYFENWDLNMKLAHKFPTGRLPGCLSAARCDKRQNALIHSPAVTTDKSGHGRS